MRGRTSVRALAEALGRLEANMTALHEEVRAFNEEERQHRRD